MQNGHLFEAMIPSVKEFEKQRDAGLFLCPFVSAGRLKESFLPRMLRAAVVLPSLPVKKEAQERLENLIKRSCGTN